MTTVNIIPYTAAHRADFARLNRAWIAKYFKVEPEDEAVLSDPETKIIAKGGHILMAELGGRIVGTVALYKHADGTFELAKMAVEENLRGQGIGKKMGEAVLALARELGAEQVYIISNTRLENSIALYRKLGFIDSPVDRHSRFERGDITLDYFVKAA